jgi:hypothetical protein
VIDLKNKKVKENLKMMSVDELNFKISVAEDDSSIVDEIASKVVSNYADDLDKLMTETHEFVTGDEYALKTLEEFLLKLSSTLYFVGSNLEKIGIRDDISKQLKSNKYNDTYLGTLTHAEINKTKKTVAEVTAIAENESQYESAVNLIYSRAYKILKFKVESGYRMVDTLKKCMSKRIAEMQLSGFDSGVTFNSDEMGDDII